MKKKMLLKMLSFMLMIVALITLLYGAVSMLQGVSAVSKSNCIGIAVLCGVAAVVAFKFSKSDNSEKQ